MAPIKKTNLAKLERGDRLRNWRKVKTWSGMILNSGSVYFESQRTEFRRARKAIEKVTKKPHSGMGFFGDFFNGLSGTPEFRALAFKIYRP